jgi:hypothetical protein
MARIKKPRETIQIEVVNWEKYQGPKRDRTNSWFKVSNQIARDEKILKLTLGARWLFIVVLGHCSSQNRYQCAIDTALLGLEISSKRYIWEKWLNELVENQLVVKLGVHIKRREEKMMVENITNGSLQIQLESPPKWYSEFCSRDTEEKLIKLVGSMDKLKQYVREIDLWLVEHPEKAPGSVASLSNRIRNWHRRDFGPQKNSASELPALEIKDWNSL